MDGWRWRDTKGSGVELGVTNITSRRNSMQIKAAIASTHNGKKLPIDGSLSHRYYMVMVQNHLQFRNHPTPVHPIRSATLASPCASLRPLPHSHPHPLSVPAH